MVGIKTLTIGYTKDHELAEKIARATGAEELLIETRPEGETLMLDTEEQAKWRNRGWRLEGRTAKKTLLANTPEENSMDGTNVEKKRELQKAYSAGGYSEGGRLKADMLFETAIHGSGGAQDDSIFGQDEDEADDEYNEQSEGTDDDKDA